MTTTPLSVHLPFNREVLGADWEPAKQGGPPPEQRGLWLLVQDQDLLVAPDGGGFRLPSGGVPAGLESAVKDPFWLGTLRGEPCWTAPLPKDVTAPGGLERQTLVPMRGTRLSDDFLSLGGMAMQALWWQSTSGFCPRCGEPTARIEGEWGKRCRSCKYEHYPHLHPAVIIMVRDAGRVLLARKAEWAPGRYALVAGFVDNGESLEGCVAREVKEEVGVDVKDIQYVGSQNWPFPSQIMLGFVASYAGGELRVDHSELEDARWFPGDNLPNRPSRHSIAGYIMQNYANPRRD